MILGTAFMNMHVRAIRCMDQYIELARGGKRPLLAQWNSSHDLPGIKKRGVDPNFEKHIEGNDDEGETKG